MDEDSALTRFESVLDQMLITFPSDKRRCVVEIVSGPSNASIFSLNDVNGHPDQALLAGEFRYMPIAGFNDSGGIPLDGFTFRVRDPVSRESSESSGVCTMTIHVRSINDHPAASNQTLSTHFNNALSITLGS
jgi:hypothetical protein